MDTPNMSNLVVENIGIIIVAIFLIVSLVIVYFTLLIRAILQMLKHNASGVLLTFSFISLIPFPLILILGIMILIIWHFHKKELIGNA
jgi:hypothetical protein